MRAFPEAWYAAAPRFSRELDDALEVAAYLWQRGWAEANGGNLSVQLGAADALPLSKPEGMGIPLPQPRPELAGRVFLVTGSGRRFRDFARHPEENGCLLRLDETGTHYRLLWGGKAENFRPTSELASHLILHSGQLSRGYEHSVVLHTHPAELIAVSHLARFKSEAALNALLLGMMPEVKVLLPHGVGLVPYELPGSGALALASLAALERGCELLLWEMHGALAVGPSLMSAFDVIDTANKGAGILLACLAAGEVPEGLGATRLAELTRAFSLGA